MEKPPRGLPPPRLHHRSLKLAQMSIGNAASRKTCTAHSQSWDGGVPTVERAGHEGQIGDRHREAGDRLMKQWYALRSKPKREVSVVALLERAEIETYLPQVSVRKATGGPPALAPFFPSYLFAHLDPFEGEIRLARYTYGVLSVVSFGGEPCPVPDDLITLIKDRLTRSQHRGLTGEFFPGDRVVVTGGPFRDTEAVFERHLSSAQRARVLIQLLHRLCKLDLRVDQLRLARQAAA